MSERAPNLVSPVRFVHWGFHAGMCVLAAWILAFGVFLAVRGPSTENPVGFTYYVVVPIVLLSGGLAGFALFRFPYGVVVDAEGILILYVHRRERVGSATIRSLELRGDFVHRNVWLIKRDGTEVPLGFRNRRVVCAWESIHR